MEDRGPRRITAEDLNQPLERRYFEKHGHDSFAGIDRSDLIHLMNDLFGPENWSDEIVTNRIVSDEVHPHPEDEKTLCRYVTAQCELRVTATVQAGTIRREATGVHISSAVITPAGQNRQGRLVPGRRGIETHRSALLGARTSALKHACYDIGTRTGGQLGELSHSQLMNEANRGQRPTQEQPHNRERPQGNTSSGRGDAPRSTGRDQGEARPQEQRGRQQGRDKAQGWDAELHQKQPEGMRNTAARLAARIREAKNADDAWSVVRGAKAKLADAGGEALAVSQVVDQLRNKAKQVGSEQW